MQPAKQISGLNGSFAICAAQFMQAFQQKYGGSLSITRAYFTTQCEANLCVNNKGCGALNNNPNPVSNHTRGLALDVTASVGQATLAQFAQANPQFGVCFPFSSAYHSSFVDNVHMILAGIPGSEPNGPGCSNVKQACSAGNFDPNTIVTPPPAPPVTSGNTTPTPTSGIANAVRNFFNPPPQAATYAQPTSVTPISSTPVSTATTQGGVCTAQYSCSNNTVYYQSDSCTSSVFQACQYGCSGTVCAPAPLGATSSVSTLQNFLNATTSSPGLTALQQFVNVPATIASAVGTSATLSLNSSIYNIVQGELSQPQAAGSASSSFIGNSGYVQQTLMSGDAAEQTSYSAQYASPLSQLFINLQSALGNLLTFLQPFGGILPSQQTPE